MKTCNPCRCCGCDPCNETWSPCEKCGLPPVEVRYVEMWDPPFVERRRCTCDNVADWQRRYTKMAQGTARSMTRRKTDER